jgi:hypothetical protein
VLHPGPDVRALNLAFWTCLLGQITAVSGCVLPRDGASGIELRWRLPEGNRADDGVADRLRTCAGARVSHVALAVRDVADSTRAASFEYPCDAGNPSPADRVAEPAEIFVDLRPGEYALELRWFDDPAERGEPGAAYELGSREEVVQVGTDGAVGLDLELATPLVPWTLELRGTAACTQLTAEIFYADAATALHAQPGLPEPDAYRGDLVSEEGLRLAAPVACDGLADGPQVFRDLDRGAYRLHLDIDGRACDREFVVDQAGAALAVDLAKPGCAG